MGASLKKGLLELQARYEVIGDVRWRGLLLGVEFVRNRDTREPYPKLAKTIARRALELGLSVSPVQAGKASIFRLAHPLTISRDEIDSGLAVLNQALQENSG